MAIETAQTYYNLLIMLHAATTFEGCIKCRPCEGQQSCVEYLQMRASREYLSKKKSKDVVETGACRRGGEGNGNSHIKVKSGG